MTLGFTGGLVGLTSLGGPMFGGGGGGIGGLGGPDGTGDRDVGEVVSPNTLSSARNKANYS